MSHEFLDYLEDMLDAMDKAEILVEGVTQDQFERDFRLNFAAVRALEILVADPRTQWRREDPGRAENRQPPWGPAPQPC